VSVSAPATSVADRREGVPASARLQLVGGSRDQEIVRLRAEGLRLAEIGRRFGLSRQRVAQIIDDAGRVQAEDVTDTRRVADARRARERSGEIFELWREGVPVGEIHERIGVTWRAIRQTIAEHATDEDRAARATALSRRRDPILPLFTDEQLLAGLRAVAARLGHPPTGGEYEQWAKKLGLASAQTVYMRFGGWSRALRRAGLEPINAPMRVYSPKWHIAACLRALVSVADQLGDPPRYQRYLELAATREDLPSAATLRVRLGLWSGIAAPLSERNGSTAAARSNGVLA
jgi:Homing endonuclease associated repeat/Sigma-70, region 4